MQCSFIAGSHDKGDFTTITGQEIFVGKGSWVGACATIMGGSFIDKGSIVGAGSLVKNKHDKFDVLVGVPAKAIKKRIPASIIKVPVEYESEDFFI